MRRVATNSRFAVVLTLVLAALCCCSGTAQVRRAEKENPQDVRSLQLNEHVATGVRVQDTPVQDVDEASEGAAVKNLDNAVLKQTNPVFEYIGNNGRAVDGKEWPDDGLQECQGDCDDDDDCFGDLLCERRSGDEPVMGCDGVALEGEDYCYDPNTPAPTATPSAAPTISEPTSSPAPTLAPSASPTDFPTGSPSASPTRVDLVELDDSMKPFNKCEGNCRDHDDCRGRLRCQRRGGYEFVPGCEGAGSPGVNYCYSGLDGVAPPALPSPGFRIRLYWERGYFWQETNRETKWCMKDTSPPMVFGCGSGTKFEIVYMKGPGDMIKVRDRDRCLERTRANAVSFRDCEPTNINQRFLANWSSRRFDIRPANKPTHCITQHHHPKAGEVVTSFECNLAHFTSTGYWERY